MAERCHKIQDIDFALFLLEPQGSEWQEFRAHYPQCRVCSAELQKWTALEHRLHSMGSAGATNHPSTETLVQFQQHPEHIATEERRTLAAHTSMCETCREEVKLIGTFDPSRIAHWVADPQPIVTAGERESWSTRLWNALRPVVFHPAFATGLVLLLSVPFIRSYYLSSLNRVPIAADMAQRATPTPAQEEAAERQTFVEKLEKRPEAKPAPQVALSAPEVPRTEIPAAVAPSRMTAKSEAPKAKEAVPSPSVADQAASREKFTRQTVPPPPAALPLPPALSLPPPAAPPLSSQAAGSGLRDAMGPPSQKSRVMAGEKKQQVIAEPQKPALLARREARSTEEPIEEFRRREDNTSQLAGASVGSAQSAGRSQEPLSPQDQQLRTALAVLMEKYKNAHAARDIRELARVWNMDQTWQETLARLFANNSQITVVPTLDENNLAPSADRLQVTVPLTQFVTAVTNEGQSATYGPLYCLADIRQLDADVWKIHELHEDPKYPGQCRLP